MKEGYPFKDRVVYHPGESTTMERSLQDLRELAMLETANSDLDNDQAPKKPNEIWCKQSIWKKFVQSESL